MGQKIHPTGFRLGVTRYWNSKWYNEKNYVKWLHEDLQLRKYLEAQHGVNTGISRIEIERMANKVKITIHTAKPGALIGKRGAGIEHDVMGSDHCPIYVDLDDAVMGR